MSSVKVNITFEEFNKNANQFIEISNKLNDNWNYILNDKNYLVKKSKTRIESEILDFEHHIVYSLSYGVPMLYFNCYKSNGTLLSLDEIWNLFKTENKSSLDMLTTITQMEHPFLFKPFFALHPCKTDELLGTMEKSKNKIISFLSVAGPAVYCNLSLEYGKFC